MKPLILAVMLISFTQSIAQTADSLRNKSHYYYLSDLKLRTSAKLILNDSIQPSDNLITFASMDSISADKKSVRDYYYPVFQKIISKADGALAEVVGSYLLAYVKRFPKEFAECYASCPKEISYCNEIKKLAGFAEFEIISQNDPQQELQNLINLIGTKYKNWKSDKTLMLFIESIKQYMKLDSN
jgi:hypothetical protein